MSREVGNVRDFFVNHFKANQCSPLGNSQNVHKYKYKLLF